INLACVPGTAKPRLRLLLDHFSKIKDTRQAWKVAYPLCEVLFLVVCGTIANCDGYDDIVDWGNAILHLLPRALALLFVMGCAMLAGQARSGGNWNAVVELGKASQK